MNSSSAQVIKRIKIIASGGASRLLISLSNVLISFIIIRFYSATVWGEFVSYIILLDVGFSLVGWGATPYLVREFSLHPKKMRDDWSEATIARSGLLLILTLVIFLLPLTLLIKLSLILWAICRFIYQSFDSIVLVERNFIFSLTVEVLAIAIVVLPAIFIYSQLHVENLLLLFSLSMGLRALFYFIYLRKWVSVSSFKLVYFKKAFPFLLLTFSAMLQQRTDLFCVAYFLDDDSTAVYQIFINFLIFGQFLSALLLSPFAKNIFRLSRISFNKLERNFMLIGLPLSLISIGGIYIIITYFYKFELPVKMYMMGYGYILMSYLYLLRNYELGKLYRQTEVAIYSFITSGVNLLLSIALTPAFGIEGALLAGLLAQVFLVALYQRNHVLKYVRG